MKVARNTQRAGIHRSFIMTSAAALLLIAGTACDVDVSDVFPNGLDQNNIPISQGDAGRDQTLGASNEPADPNAPTVSDVSAATVQAGPLVITLSGESRVGGDLTFSIGVPPIHGRLGIIDNSSIRTATVEYVPEPGFMGVDGFLFKASDEGGDSNIGFATISVHQRVVFTVEPVQGPSPLRVTGRAFTENGDPPPSATYVWSFGNETNAGEETTHTMRSHVFENPGTYAVTLSLVFAGGAPISCFRQNTGEQVATVTAEPAISGFVRDQSGNGIPAVTMAGNYPGSSAVTDANGFYKINVSYNWTNAITPVHAEYSFTPTSRFYANVTQHIMAQNFVAVGGGGPCQLSESFGGYAPGTDPLDWLDTAANSSLAGDDSLFEIMDVAGNRAYGTTSTSQNIHSHYAGAGSSAWASYSFKGRMMITDANAGIGVTFSSDYPNADKYYRLRRYQGNPTFHIAPHGTTITGGTTSTGFAPTANGWCRFRIEVEDTGSQSVIRAKMWSDGASEPAGWQVDCYDASPGRLKSGTIGLWAMGSGAKYWDDLDVCSDNILNCLEDSDGDGVLDCDDACPTDPNKADPGACGCGTEDIDTDGDGTPDCDDACPTDPNKTAPGGCGCGVSDADSDGDGVPDCIDQCPGVPDTDSDGDGVPDCIDQCPGAPDVDSDGDGVLDCNDGCPNDPNKTEPGDCGCGQPDIDSDGDGVLDCDDGCPTDPNKTDPGVCGCNVPDEDLDGDGVIDCPASPIVPVIVASRTSGVAPLAIFFEATDSQDAAGRSINSDGLLGNDLTEYTWDFGDGTTSSGFNAAHVFEPPGPNGPNGEPNGAGASYNVTLTVYEGNDQVSTTQLITVHPFSGTTYYVRADGDDNNTGLGSSAGQAWKTYNKGFSSHGSGNRVLFKRGDTFTYSTPAGLGSGRMVADYGSEHDGPPIIQYTGTDSGSSAAPIGMVNADGASIVNMHFKLESTSSGSRAHGFSTWNATNLLLLRVTIEDYDDCTGYADGLFVVDSILTNAALDNIYYRGARLVLLNNQIGPADSHNIYGSLLDRAVIQGNALYDPDPELRGHNIRLGANHDTSRNVLVTNNDFDGGGTWLAVQFAISSGSWDPAQHCENLLFEGNTVRNAGMLIQSKGDYRDTLVRNNYLVGGNAFRIQPSPNPQIPLDFNGPRGLWFHGNHVTNNGEGWFADSAPSSQNVHVWSNTINGVVVEGVPPP